MANEEQVKVFIARHRELLAREREAEIEKSSLLLTNCGPKLLEQRGLALGGLGVVGVNIGLGGKTLVELERPSAYHTVPNFPPHILRPGDLARIEDNVASNGPSKKAVKGKSTTAKQDLKARDGRTAEGVVYKVSDTRIVIAVDVGDSSTDELDLPDRCRVLKLANSVTYDRMEKALDYLEKTAIPSSRQANDQGQYELTPLMRVLLGMSPPSEKLQVSDVKFFDDSLNPSQKEAVRFALESPEVACIHGPPGTGKTHTLIEIIRQLTVASSQSKPKRILVCGASNLSVDNILERLLALPSSEKTNIPQATRIGHPARVMAQDNILESTLEVKASRSDQAALAKDVKNELDATLGVLSGKGKTFKGKAPRGLERKKLWEEVKALRKEYRQREGRVVKAVLGNSQVVLATCHSAGGRQLRDHSFDVVIIDEATQAMEAVCWIPIFKGKKLILAGDPMQLPPTVLSINNKQKKSKTSNKAVKSPQKLSGDRKSTKGKEEHLLLSERMRVTSNISGHESTEEEGSEAESSDVNPADNAEKNAKKDPTNITLRSPRTLETTLFDRLEKMYGPNIKRMLDVQYRMHTQICEFPSKTLYSSKLKSHESVASHLLRDLPGTKVDSKEEEKEVLATPVVFFDTAGCEYYERMEGDGDEGSRCNENEATVVKNWIERLIEAGVQASQIAIITPYQAQVTLLSSLLRPTYGPQLEIGTVDGMQGREKDGVVISLVRSNEKREVGFLRERRRLNVAMTRAKRHLCIIGDSSTVSQGGAFLRKWMAWLETNADVRYGGLD